MSGKGDPMEEAVERWLIANAIYYSRADAKEARLDFYLPEFNVYIECKQFHTPRIAEQMSRAENVIAIQGMGSVRLLEALIARRASQ